MGSHQGEVKQKGADNTKKGNKLCLDRDGFGHRVVFEEVKWV